MKLTVTLAQMEVVTSAPEENLRKTERRIAEAARRGSDLICFPEMWTTGFNWKANARLAGRHDSVVQRIASLACRYRIWINGSVLSRNAEGNLENTSILINPEGEKVCAYSKTHLFSFMREDKHMTPGDALLTFDAPWGKTGFGICYEIRFPEIYRTYALQGVKVVLNPTAFPHPRRDHWKTLLRARAIENQFFMIGTNQVGNETVNNQNRITYCGTSLLVDPSGKTILEAGEDEEALLTATIDIDEVDGVRNHIKVFQDRKPALYNLGSPSHESLPT